jgi:RNA polymerase sigma-70 factor (ECF subfamily)
MQQEADLIRAAQTGSHDAFRALVERYHLLVLHTARILLDDASTAEDVAQEAWVNAWRALGGFDQSRPFRPWMLRIVTNCCRIEMRRRAPETALEQIEAILPAGEDSLLAGVIRREEFAALDMVIASLPALQRQIVELRYRADLALGEIALVMHLPIGTVKSRLHRALTTVRQQVAQEDLARKEGAQ